MKIDRVIAPNHHEGELRRASIRLTALGIPQDELLIAFLAPPWGNALSKQSGLDLRRTEPPLTGIVDLIANTFPRTRSPT